MVIQNQDPFPISFLIDNVNIFSINADGGLRIPGSFTSSGNIPRFKITSNTTHGVRVNPSGQTSTTQINAHLTGGGSSEADIAVRGTAVDGGGNNNIGVRGRAVSAQTLNVGIWAETCALSGGIAARFIGDLTLTGDLWDPSDLTLKENVQDISHQDLENLSALDVKSFYFFTRY